MRSTDVTFTKISLPNGWLNNMAPFAVQHAGFTWRTAEHFFQAHRFAMNHQVRQEILNTASPMGAKMAAKKFAAEMLIVPRSEPDLFLMEETLRLKLLTNPHLRGLLRETGTARIIEDVSRRGPTESNLFWGMSAANGAWVGQNKLGELWMKLRAEVA